MVYLLPDVASPRGVWAVHDEEQSSGCWTNHKKSLLANTFALCSDVDDFPNTALRCQLSRVNMEYTFSFKGSWSKYGRESRSTAQVWSLNSEYLKPTSLHQSKEPNVSKFIVHQVN